MTLLLGEEATVNKVPGHGINGELYPDLVEQRGLSQAMTALANEGGFDLGEISTPAGAGSYTSVEIESTRGVVRVLLGVDSRWFSITIADPNHTWAYGGSPDLVDVVRVADSWRKGIGVQDLRERFPFLDLDDLALAYESGDPIAMQWTRLLRDRELSKIHSLLVAAYSNGRLRALFPYVSHLTLLRMMRDPKNRAAGEIWITQGSGEFWVEDPGKGPRLAVGAVEKAVVLAASMV